MQIGKAVGHANSMSDATNVSNGNGRLILMQTRSVCDEDDGKAIANIIAHFMHKIRASLKRFQCFFR